MKLLPLYRYLILSAIGVLLLAIAGTGFWIRRQINNQHAHGAGGRAITIEPGASTAAIIAHLHREGILAREFPAQVYLRFFAGKRSLKAGDYEFKSPISPREAIEKVLRGEVVTRYFTIPEGYNQFDIARVLFGITGLKQPAPATPEELLPLFKNTALIADLDPQADSLEGYLFPATYESTASTTREAMVEAMVKRFRKVFTPAMQQQASERGMNIRQAVTMASLVEEEAKVDAERELISSVFHRRLKMGIQLACDPTVVYAALLAGKYRGTIYRSDLDRESPYNTYRHAGMPPGPIASPGRRSLEAAVKPAETDYLYFVVDVTRSDGAHKFSASSADHERAVALLRRQEQERKTQSQK
jgi:UPF0755 protein